jgi:hypothetical protein
MELSCYQPYSEALTELVADAVATLGEAPLYVQMGAGDTAGATFQASLVIDADVVLLQPIYICRTQIKAGLLQALLHTFPAVYYFKVAFLVHLETV